MKRLHDKTILKPSWFFWNLNAIYAKRWRFWLFWVYSLLQYVATSSVHCIQAYYLYISGLNLCLREACTEGNAMMWCKSKQRPTMCAHNISKPFLRHLITRHCIQNSHTNNITTHTHIQIRTQPSTFTLCLSPSLIHSINLHIYLPTRVNTHNAW